ncbi:DUF4845 domain-containing protein [Candidatus Symbiobacter mobilis]|uniref:Transmembrane protein n=1 Tax=Candidatus Symbiobacter mobilis CR TaxID=946483 RepID=U5NB87_9BURK|nr:DUF4845 domain-containing protein [Candidatus Symbiobacter mobilis]AGX88580.1 hypothetical protein Cenrod_2526 [Candidatus Symbiobacter mobilis CR]
MTAHTMHRSALHSQRGVTFIGFLFIAGFLAALGVVVAQIVPTALEYQAVLTAVKRAKDAPTIPDIRMSFNKSAGIDNISSISGKDLDIRKDGNEVVISFSYQREIHLAGPAYLTLKYTGDSR